MYFCRLSVCQKYWKKISGVQVQHFVLANSSVMAEWIKLKFHKMFIRVPSFASDRHCDQTRSVEHGQNVIVIIPPKQLNAMNWKLQEVILLVPRFSNRKHFYHARWVRHGNNIVWTISPKCLDGLSWTFQEIFIYLSTLVTTKNVYNAGLA